MSFLFAETAAMATSAATTEALAMTTTGATGQAAAVGAVVPPGLEEISVANVARIEAYAAQVAAMLCAAGAFQALYGTSVTISGVTYEATDVLSGLSMKLSL